MLAVISMVDICSISDIRASNASSYRFIQNSLHFLESHIVPEQYSIKKIYPNYSVSRKGHLTYTNVRNNFQKIKTYGLYEKMQILRFLMGLFSPTRPKFLSDISETVRLH